MGCKAYWIIKAMWGVEEVDYTKGEGPDIIEDLSEIQPIIDKIKKSGIDFDSISIIFCSGINSSVCPNCKKAAGYTARIQNRGDCEVDNGGHWEQDLDVDDTEIYGPFECRNCGKDFDEIPK